MIGKLQSGSNCRPSLGLPEESKSSRLKCFLYPYPKRALLNMRLIGGQLFFTEVASSYITVMPISFSVRKKLPSFLFSVDVVKKANLRVNYLQHHAFCLLTFASKYFNFSLLFFCIKIRLISRGPQDKEYYEIRILKMAV